MRLGKFWGTVAAITFFAVPAAADSVGVWHRLDVRVPIVKTADDRTFNVRVIPEFIFTNDVYGLKQTTLRAGLGYDFVSWFSLGLNGVTNNTGTNQEVKVEAQPEFILDFTKPLQVRDRNRVSFRPGVDAPIKDRWNYSNELRLILNFSNSPMSLFGSYEGFYNFSVERVNQHKMSLGVGTDLGNGFVVNTGYLLQKAQTTFGWADNHFLFVSLESIPRK